MYLNMEKKIHQAVTRRARDALTHTRDDEDDEEDEDERVEETKDIEKG